MRVGNPISDMAMAVSHALVAGLPAIRYSRQQRPEGMEFTEYKRQLILGMLPSVTEEMRPIAEDLDVFVFPQTWASTALGFGGIGGASYCTANTIVVVCRKAHAASVYFGSGHAYNVDMKDATVQKLLNDDIRDRRIPSRRDALERYKVLAGTDATPSAGATP